jgi:hypothetical protein
MWRTGQAMGFSPRRPANPAKLPPGTVSQISRPRRCHGSSPPPSHPMRTRSLRPEASDRHASGSQTAVSASHNRVEKNILSSHPRSGSHQGSEGPSALKTGRDRSIRSMRSHPPGPFPRSPGRIRRRRRPSEAQIASRGRGEGTNSQKAPASRSRRWSPDRSSSASASIRIARSRPVGEGRRRIRTLSGERDSTGRDDERICSVIGSS